MREIVRSVQGTNTQFAAIEWQDQNLFLYELVLFESDDSHDLMVFNENIEWLYKKWLAGDAVEFTAKSSRVTWDLKQKPVPGFLLQKEKNEYLFRKAQKRLQEFYSVQKSEAFSKEAAAITENLQADPDPATLDLLHEKAKTLDEQIKQAVTLTKNGQVAENSMEEGITNDAYFLLKPTINAIFEKIKQLRAGKFDVNYNTISPVVEAAYTQAKEDPNFNETRKYLIDLQKEVLAKPLERWQKNELMDRLRAAFDHINKRQDEWRLQEDSKRVVHTEMLQKQFDEVIPKALGSSFNEGFAQLKELQELTNKASILRDKRDHFYTALNTAFTTLKEKADSENESNFALASKQIEVAILASANTDLFKDARAILIAAQNDLKEIRLQKNKKDILFGKLREAFDKLNEEQDAYFRERKNENRNQLEKVLINMKRILSRKIEGMETLYHAKSNIEAKTGMIKVAKNSSSDLVNQFLERQTEIIAKIAEAEKDIAQLEKKIEKMEKELKATDEVKKK